MRAVASEAQFNDAADASQMLGEELIKRGEEMLTLGRRLLAQADDLNAAASGLTVTVGRDYLVDSVSGQPDEQRSVGKQGEVRIGTAIEKAKALGTFTRKEFEEATGLNTVAANRWLTKLINNKPPIVERVVGGTRGRASLFRYLEIEGSGPTSRTSHARAVDAAAGVGADRTSSSGAVPYTGRPVGSSGKPGRDKQLSKKRRVKRRSGQIIGGSK